MRSSSCAHLPINPPRRFASLEEAIAQFKVMPRETFADRAILDRMARYTYKRLDDGAWTHKLDRRTLIREPLSVWDSLHRIECPTLVVKLTLSNLMSRDVAQRMVLPVAERSLCRNRSFLSPCHVR